MIQIESKDGMYHIYLEEQLGDLQIIAPKTASPIPKPQSTPKKGVAHVVKPKRSPRLLNKFFQPFGSENNYKNNLKCHIVIDEEKD